MISSIYHPIRRFSSHTHPIHLFKATAILHPLKAPQCYIHFKDHNATSTLSSAVIHPLHSDGLFLSRFDFPLSSLSLLKRGEAPLLLWVINHYRLSLVSHLLIMRLKDHAPFDHLHLTWLISRRLATILLILVIMIHDCPPNFPISVRKKSTQPKSGGL